jgi:hypothetical protein
MDYNCNYTDPGMAERRMENKKNKRETNWQKDDRNVYSGMLLLWRNSGMTEFLRRNYAVNTRRLELLESIFHKMGERRNDEIESEIYLYGSLIKGEDLMARQIFLWLLGMLAEEERNTAKRESQE